MWQICLIIKDNGLLDISEALQGVLHLFGGTEEDKIAAGIPLLLKLSLSYKSIYVV